VRVYGDTALAFGVFSRIVRFKNKEGQEQEEKEGGHFGDLWVKRQGHWQVAFSLESKMPK
jgi:hypothetical protein